MENWVCEKHDTSGRFGECLVCKYQRELEEIKMINKLSQIDEYIKKPEEQPMVKILGEEFYLDKDDDNSFIISHPKWSLLGWGFTYKSAHSHLLEQIETTKNFYKDVPDADFTEKGLKFKQWLMTVSFNKLNKE